MAGWLRLYTEIRNDRKLRRLPAGQRWLWVVMLTIAKESPRAGWLLLSENVPVGIDDLADEAAISPEEVLSGIEAFKAQNMLEEVDGVYRLVNWDKRQFASDNSTSRWRKWKEEQEQDVEPTTNQQQTNVGQSLDKHPQSTEYRVQSTDTDKDKDKDIYTVFDHWNGKGIIKHKAMSKAKAKHITARFNEGHTVEAICEAIDNYDIILKSDEYYWSHRWTLWNFLQRGLENFLTDSDPFTTYRVKGGQPRAISTGPGNRSAFQTDVEQEAANGYFASQLLKNKDPTKMPEVR
jgi:hypothetical protein